MPKAAARHILVASSQACEDLKKEIEGGAEFADLARQHSTCPSSRRGGDLGEFTPGMMVPEFDKVVFSAAVGEVQGPVKTQFGYHLIGGHETRRLMSEGISFNSKIDTWLLVVLLTGVAGCLLAALYLIQGATGMRIVAGLLFLVAALIVWPLVTTRYVLSDAQLRIRCGPITWTVPVTEITAVTPTRNPLSSPALSLDRIRIDYGKGRSIMLAPEPREAFLRQLQARRV